MKQCVTRIISFKTLMREKLSKESHFNFRPGTIFFIQFTILKNIGDKTTAKTLMHLQK